MKKRVLFISTLHRSSERFFEGFKSIEGVDVVALNVGQASIESTYSANRSYLERQKDVFLKVINGPGVKNSSETRSEEFSKKVQKEILKVLKTKKYDLVVIDDDRDSIRFIKDAYLTVKSFSNIPFVSVREGVIIHDRYYDKNKRYFDYLMCVGNYDKEYFLKRDNIKESRLLKIGIPENDKISKLKEKEGDYCLVVLNYICKRPAKKFFDHNQKQVFLNKDFVENIGLKEIQKKQNIEIVVKIKNRFGENIKEAIDQVKRSFEGLNFKILTDVNSDIELIRNAKLVISYGSNMTIKSMAMNKPTVIIEGMGYLSFFNGYFNKYNVENKKDSVFNIIESFDIVKNKNFLNENIEGSTTFSACQSFKDSILKILEDKND
jgi:hypothetical protein